MPNHRFLRLPALFLLLALLSCGGRQEPVWWDSDLDQKLDREIGQMLLVGFRGQALDPGSSLSRDLERLNIGGVILFDYDVELKKPGRNIHSPEQVRRLTRRLQSLARTPLFVAVDQEGGRVTRLKPEYGFAPLPSAAEMGRGRTQRTEQLAAAMARTMAELGINLDFAPVLDLNVNPDNPVIGKLGRSFGRDPKRVAAHGLAFVQGLHRGGVLACVKHFPGHGSSLADSHQGFTDVSATWSREELEPFAALIRSKECDMVMTGHLFNSRLDPQHPATLSRKTITGLLRGALGFDGVVVTDDLQMGAISRHYGMEQAMELAVNAGADILLLGNNLEYDPNMARRAHTILKKLVREERIPRSRIKESYERIMGLKARLGAAG